MPRDLTIQEVLMRVETEGRVWAILPSLIPMLTAFNGREIDPEKMAEIESKMGRNTQKRANSGATAVIPLKGVLMPQVSFIAMLFGLGSSLTQFREDLRAASADPEVGTIVLDVDSPGGIVDLIPEVAADIREARKAKPVVAVSNTMAASAAYWLASQADEIVLTPSGSIGSIGVYQLHFDESRFYDAEGVTPTVIKAGKYKIEGNPWEPLSDEARNAIQGVVNDYYSMFTKDVAKGRGDTVSNVREGYGEGRVLTSKHAVEAGLADRVDTLEATVARASRGQVTSRSQTAQAGDTEDTSSGEGDNAPTEATVEYTAEEKTRLVDTLALLG